MGVYFRTGENTAAGVSWPVYFFLVLPTQLLIVWPMKILFWVLKWLALGTVVAGAFLVRAGRGMLREESRPPAV